MITKTRTSRYTHIPLNQDVEAIAGYYTPEKEVRMRYGNREILYVTGHVVIETTCGSGCMPANYWYATIPGYIVNWQTERNKKGYPVTEIEVINDTATQNTLRKIILQNEAIARVDFW